MKSFLKFVAVVAVLVIIYYGYKDLSNKGTEKPLTETVDSSAVKTDTTKVVSKVDTLKK